MKRNKLALTLLLALCSLSLLAAKKPAAPPAVTETEVWFDDLKKPAAMTTEQGVSLVKQLRTEMLAGKPVKDILAGISYDDAAPRVLFLTLGDGIFPGRTYYAAGSQYYDEQDYDTAAEYIAGLSLIILFCVCFQTNHRFIAHDRCLKFCVSCNRYHK